LPWNGGAKLITLRDMKEYLASRLIEITRHVVNAQCIMIEAVDVWPDGRKEIEGYAKEVWKEAKFLGLKSTERQAARLYNYSSDEEKKDPDLEAAAQELSRRFDEDLEGFPLFYVSADKLSFYNKTDLFGETFKANFPTANAEIIEAGTCLAFDRFTACAFHLSRATEIVLRVVFVSLGLPPRIWSVTKWKQLADRTGGKIAKNNVRLVSDPTWQADKSFYEKAHAFLEAARNPIRNSTVHVDVTYPDEGSVRPVWLATEAFMRHIATKLKETP
jgi:hypothetical protein